MVSEKPVEVKPRVGVGSIQNIQDAESRIVEKHGDIVKFAKVWVPSVCQEDGTFMCPQCGKVMKGISPSSNGGGFQQFKCENCEGGDDVKAPWDLLSGAEHEKYRFPRDALCHLAAVELNAVILPRKTAHATRQKLLLENDLILISKRFKIVPLFEIGAKSKCSCGRKEGEKCKPGKHPRPYKGLKEASNDRARIIEWRSKWPCANTAIVMGDGLCCIDADGEVGKANLAALQHKDRLGPLPPTMTQETGGGGLQLFFKYPQDVEVKNTASVLADSIDVRGEGGMSVVPPSNHLSGNLYQWLPGQSPDEIDVAELPERWLEAMARPKREVNEYTNKDSMLEEMAPLGTDEGVILDKKRNASLISIAGTLRNYGLAESEISATLIEINRRRCQPPLEENEVRGIAESAAKYAPGKLPTGKKAPVVIEISNFLTLQETEMEPTNWIVDGLIPPGLYLFVAKPKIGKSWMAFNFCLDLANGRQILGCFPCKPCDTLYMALEDNPRTLKERLAILSSGGHTPNANAHYTCEWPRLDFESGGFDQLMVFLDQHPTIRLVVIDTLQQVRPFKKGNISDYERDYNDLSPLHKLAAERQIAIFLVHHMKKEVTRDVFDSPLGSTANTAVVDGTWALQRQRGEDVATLSAVGRALRNDIRFALRFVRDKGYWEYTGEAADFQRTKEREAVRSAFIAAGKPMSIKEVMEYTKQSYYATQHLLRRMADDCVLEKALGRGKYQLLVAPTLSKGKAAMVKDADDNDLYPASWERENLPEDPNDD